MTIPTYSCGIFFIVLFFGPIVLIGHFSKKLGTKVVYSTIFIGLNLLFWAVTWDKLFKIEPHTYAVSGYVEKALPEDHTMTFGDYKQWTNGWEKVMVRKIPYPVEVTMSIDLRPQIFVVALPRCHDEQMFLMSVPATKNISGEDKLKMFATEILYSSVKVKPTGLHFVDMKEASTKLKAFGVELKQD